MPNPLNYKPFGSRAILVEWPARVDEEILYDILRYKEQIISYSKDQIEDGIVGYHSLTILYADEIADFTTEVATLRSIYSADRTALEGNRTRWEIPVCYDVSFGVDLKAVADTLRLSQEDIIQRHSGAIYTVYFIGFLPGFLYLGGLDDQLAIPRKSDPRLNVAKGSVAIGGSQTGVYPTDSAGGWHIIGKTPVSFFDIGNENPCFAQAGDKIQFIPIDLDEFKRLEMDINRGAYQVPSHPLND